MITVCNRLEPGDTVIARYGGLGEFELCTVESVDFRGRQTKKDTDAEIFYNLKDKHHRGPVLGSTLTRYDASQLIKYPDKSTRARFLKIARTAWEEIKDIDYSKALWDIRKYDQALDSMLIYIWHTMGEDWLEHPVCQLLWKDILAEEVKA